MKVISAFKDITKFIDSSDHQTSAKIKGHLILLSNLGHNLRMPYSKQISRNLFELRIRSVHEVRIFYCFHKNIAYLLHIFNKKSKKTPAKELNLAQTRLKIVLTGI